MGATQQQFENASKYGLAERDVRALTEYLTVLGNVGRARDAEGLYLVVSQSGREYLVDAEQGVCECDDFRFRGGECKHLRRVAFATGRRAIPTVAAVELDVDPSIGEHVEGELRYVATDGGEPSDVLPSDARQGSGDERSESSGARRSSSEPRSDGGESGEASAETRRTDAWIVRDRGRGKIREFDSRSAAESAIEDLEGLGLDVELLEPGADSEGGRIERVERTTPDEPESDELGRRSIADDPVAWLPDEFVDWIEGTPAINRKGFEVLAHFYGVSVESDVEVSPADTEFEYAQVKATAIMPDGRRSEALGSAHVDRGDDPGVLLELADTRARKRAISIATGMGTVAVEELRSEAGRA